jgi:hypothetical protein
MFAVLKRKAGGQCTAPLSPAARAAHAAKQMANGQHQTDDTQDGSRKVRGVRTAEEMR